MENSNGEIHPKETGELPVEETGELEVEETGELPVEETGELAVEETGELAVEETGELTVEETGELPVKKTGELQVVKTGELPVEKTGELPVVDVMQEKKSHETTDDHNKNDDKELEKDIIREELLDHIKNTSAIFKGQERGEPELTTTEKRQIAKELLDKNPVKFLQKFGEFLKEEHLNYLLSKFSSSYEIQYHVKHLKDLLNDDHRKMIKRNRRYEAMTRMEEEGIYFSETEMEKREPLLYYEMIGQYLNEKEKLLKHQAQGDTESLAIILINKIEREEMYQLVKTQQEEEDKIENIELSSEEEHSRQSDEQKQWGEDWEEEKSRMKIKKRQPKKQNIQISVEEKNLLHQEFLSMMKNNFISGKDSDFNYSEVDSNCYYDSIDIRAQDEQDKYFDEETYDSTICTDTGVEDY